MFLVSYLVLLDAKVHVGGDRIFSNDTAVNSHVITVGDDLHESD